MDDQITLDDILAELGPHGRELVEQAVASAQKIKALKAELARATIHRGDVPPAGEPADV